MSMQPTDKERADFESAFNGIDYLHLPAKALAWAVWQAARRESVNVRMREGWQWVPVEITQEMADAWAVCPVPMDLCGRSDDEANLAVAQAEWTAMLSAAPKAQEVGAGKDAARCCHRWPHAGNCLLVGGTIPLPCPPIDPGLPQGAYCCASVGAQRGDAQRGDALDAARYRWHRSIGGRSWTHIEAGALATNELYDAATDAAMSGASHE